MPSRLLLALALVLLAGLGSARADQLPPVVINGDPVAPSPGIPGTGLCVASRVSTQPSWDFSQDSAYFFQSMQVFFDHAPEDRTTSVFRVPFDLSNNNPSIQGISDGDFVNAVPGCPSGGCGMFKNDTFTSFGSRFRGYLDVPPEWIGQTVHFGFYTDDAVGLVIYDRNAQAHFVVIRPPELGAPTWRAVNSVTFKKAGLYPVEVIYAQISEHAALEMSAYLGEFSDFERPANQEPITKLSANGFVLLQPSSFYQTEVGSPPYPDLNQCSQCNRSSVNTVGQNGCDSGYYCNSAALCSPCDLPGFCGPMCLRCGGATPLCANVSGEFTCVQCTEDSQCANGRCDLSTNQCSGCNDDGDCRSQGQVCDLERNQCVECNVDANCPTGKFCATETHQCKECVSDGHCPRGEFCVDNACQPCSTKDSCAGTSCNCCPGGLKCASPTPGTAPSCVECTSDADCTEGKRCDLANGSCVEKVSECNTSERCGAQCARCPSDRPFCLDGQVCVGCRTDLECGDGKFCLSGECASCTTDKRCGTRCEACSSDTPFCLTDGTAAGSTCVGCRNDAECGPGGKCDPTTRTCSASSCAVSCAEGTVCLGTSCVECFADAHCPCGGTCDTASNVCTTSCDDSSDCLGVQHCSAATQQCERGRRKPGTEASGGAFCCGATGQGAPGFALLLLAATLLAFRPRRAV